MKRIITALLAAALLFTACGEAPAGSGTEQSEKLPAKTTAVAAVETVTDDTADETEADTVSAVDDAETAAVPESDTEPQPEEPFVMPDFYTGKVYRIEGAKYDFTEMEEYYYLDQEGHLLDGDCIPSAVPDLLSGEPVYYVKEEYEKGENGEEHIFSVLYDRDGNVLEERGEYNYTQSFGKLVVRHDSKMAAFWLDEEIKENDSCLYDPTEHKVVQNGIGALVRYSDDIAIACDVWYETVAFIDADGNIIKTTDKSYTYPVCFGEYIQCSSGEYNHSELYKGVEMEFIDSAPGNEWLTVFDCGERGSYIEHRYEDPVPAYSVLYDMEDYHELLRLPEKINYIDGSRMVTADVNAALWYLTDMQANILTGPYVFIVTPEITDPLYGERFLAYDGERLILLDADANVLAEKETGSGVFYAYLSEGLIFADREVLDDEGNETSWEYLTLDLELRSVLDEEKYVQAMPVTDGIYAYELKDYYGRIKRDLVDSEGNIIMASVSRIGDADEDAIAIMRGFDIGLIDHQGNWIRKNSLYDADDFD